MAFMRELPFVVEVNMNGRFFEPLAAFNVQSIAEAYADDCRKAHKHFEYRVRAISELECA